MGRYYESGTKTRTENSRVGGSERERSRDRHGEEIETQGGRGVGEG